MSWQIAGRPISLIFVAATLALNAVAALAAAFGLVEDAKPGRLGSIVIGLGLPSAALSILIAALLVWRDYQLLTFQRGGWRATVIIAAVSVGSAMLSFGVAPRRDLTWVDLAVSVATLAILLRPSVRRLFF